MYVVAEIPPTEITGQAVRNFLLKILPMKLRICVTEVTFPNERRRVTSKQ